MPLIMDGRTVADVLITGIEHQIARHNTADCRAAKTENTGCRKSGEDISAAFVRERCMTCYALSWSAPLPSLYSECAAGSKRIILDFIDYIFSLAPSKQNIHQDECSVW